MKLGKSLFAALLLILVIIAFSINQSSSTEENTTTVLAASELDTTAIDEEVYPHDEVIKVNIEISESNYNTLVANAMDEEYYLCDITYNGYTLYNVAIRAKGNSSLKNVFESGGDRYSFNIDLNYYLDQDLFGVDRLILNNLYQDPTMMAEYISYEALDSLGAVSSRTTFTALYINDEYYGLYLSVEDVGNEFLEENYGDSLGSLYKPELGTGADLDYVSDTYNYASLIDDYQVDPDNTAIIDLMEALSLGEDIDDYLNVDSFLQYLAMSTFTVHLDSYQSGMYHNYYLYNNNGLFEWI
ncbi:MAG: CotH kinase family protein, partial [Firmicutes bacterium]|nr:CotH kinase family protein [Bacillota bacterium]